jgi:hypothetical protein
VQHSHIRKHHPRFLVENEDSEEWELHVVEIKKSLNLLTSNEGDKNIHASTRQSFYLRSCAAN